MAAMRPLPLRPLRHLATAALLLLPGSFSLSAHTQEPASSTAQPAKCPTRTAPLSPGEQAATARDPAPAETLLRAEAEAPGEAGDRAHSALIRLLLREQKLDAAEADAKTWAAAAPKNSWAQTSLADTQWRAGEIKEAIDSLNAAGKLDSCNPRTHASLSRLKLFQGNYASARAQINYAHGLDPVSEDITNRWMSLQSHAKRIADINSYLASTATITPERRRALEHTRDILSNPAADQPCRLAGSVTSATIPFHRIQNGPNARIFWGLEVNFNGKVRHMEIDTGAHGLLLSRAAAQDLHLEVEQRNKIGGIGDDGAVNAFISHVKFIKIGSLEFADCDVQVLDAESGTLKVQDGLIGGDVFQSFALTLDYPGHQLKLDPLPPLPDTTPADTKISLATDNASTAESPLQDAYVDPTMASWTKVFRSGHSLIVPVRLENGPIRLFLVDTGSHMDVISPAVAQGIGRDTTGAFTNAMGISGKVKQTLRTGPLTLSFAGLRYPSPGMLAFDTSGISRGAGVQLAGILGTPTLRTLTLQIDYRDNLVHFVYDPKRVVKCVGQSTGDCD